MIAVELVSHIRTDAQGQAWIDETNVKVIEVIKDWLAHGSSPEKGQPAQGMCGIRGQPLRGMKTLRCAGGIEEKAPGARIDAKSAWENF